MGIKQASALALLSFSFLSTNLAHADSVYKPGSPDAEPGADLVVGAGATFGGDELATVIFTNNSTESVDAGALLDLKIGFEYFFEGHTFSLQSTIGYHFDSVDAQNGDTTFSRIPIDIIGFVNQGNHRFGLGGTYHMNPEFEVNFGSSTDVDFDDALGFLVEYGYRMQSSAIIAVRAVQIDYEVSGVPQSSEFSGNHIGIYAYGNF